MAEARLFEELFRVLEKNPAPRWIFGEPVTLAGKQVMPVSSFRLVVELPAVATPAPEGSPAPAAGSLRMEGLPVGFLGEQEGQIVFVPIQPESPADEAADGPAPRWVDDLFRKLDEVRWECSRGSRDDDDDDGCRGRSRCDDDEPRQRRGRRNRDDRD